MGKCFEYLVNEKMKEKLINLVVGYYAIAADATK